MNQKHKHQKHKHQTRTNTTQENFSPWGKKNPRRGEQHLYLAKGLFEHFGFTPEDGESIPVATWDSYLMKIGEMPSGTSKEARGTFSKKFVDKVRMASHNRPLMEEIGLQPFEPDWTGYGWRLKTMRTALEDQKPIKRVGLQIHRSRINQEEIVRALCPIRDKDMLPEAALSLEVTTLYEKVANLVDDNMMAATKRIRRLLKFGGNDDPSLVPAH